jgi:linoleoyl-CoA desaturase
MKGRVDAYVKQHRLTRTAWPLYVKSAVLLSLWAACYYLSIIRGHVLASVLLGFFHAQLGINIMHDGNHGAYLQEPSIKKGKGKKKKTALSLLYCLVLIM